MDDIILFAKNEKEFEKIYSQDIGMKFRIDKCVMLIIRDGSNRTTKSTKIERSE